MTRRMKQIEINWMMPLIVGIILIFSTSLYAQGDLEKGTYTLSNNVHHASPVGQGMARSYTEVTSDLKVTDEGNFVTIGFNNTQFMGDFTIKMGGKNISYDVIAHNAETNIKKLQFKIPSISTSIMVGLYVIPMDTQVEYEVTLDKNTLKLIEKAPEAVGATPSNQVAEGVTSEEKQPTVLQTKPNTNEEKVSETKPNANGEKAPEAKPNTNATKTPGAKPNTDTAKVPEAKPNADTAQSTEAKPSNDAMSAPESKLTVDEGVTSETSAEQAQDLEIEEAKTTEAKEENQIAPDQIVTDAKQESTDKINAEDLVEEDAVHTDNTLEMTGNKQMIGVIVVGIGVLIGGAVFILIRKKNKRG